MLQFWRRFSPKSWSYQHVLTDIVILATAMYFSLWLRLGSTDNDGHWEALNHFIAVFVIIQILCMMSFGVYRSMWRYISTSDAIVLAKAIGVATPLLISITFILQNFGTLPRSVFFINAFVSLAFLMLIRVARRRVYELKTHSSRKDQYVGRMLIYGAGMNGRLFAQRLLNDPNRNMELLGFIDDAPEKKDRVIGGLPVLGNGALLEPLLEKTGATDLVIAISHPPAELLRQIVLLARKYQIRPQVISDLSATGIQPKSVSLYRQLELGDLLNRKPTEIDVQSVAQMIEGKRVLVTGAGGSIGAELSRQVFRFNPEKLLLLDHSEYNLYEIDRELRPSADANNKVVPLLTDIKDNTALKNIFDQYKPEVVFHAAAYKHVHLVEANTNAAILNNILGTQNLIEHSIRINTERFLLVSTDKAVNPIGVMGATKRACEMLTTMAGLKTKKQFSSVRFGNVLGSSGSLIPLLKEQIHNGGPVTLTHPDMNRFFMLIPEAVSLVLMSSALSEPGDINVLRMGEPIKIVDIAKSLITLMGKTEEEIPVVFTGIRPGEKMFEELYIKGDELQTRHADILTLPKGATYSLDAKVDYNQAIQMLIKSAEEHSADSKSQLLKFVSEGALTAPSSSPKSPLAH